jgi:hypothetical protein
MSEENRNAVFSSQVSQEANSVGVPRRDMMLEEFGYQVPVETVPLPSGGITYPKGSVLHGVDSIDIRAMTAKEEDILTSRALIKKGTVISHLLNNCIATPGVNSETMLSGDRNAVMVALRITGYGNDYNVEIDCPECGEKSKQTFNLSDLEIKNLDIRPVAEGENIFEFKLPVMNVPVKFKFMTGRDEQEFMNQQERTKKLGLAGDRLVTQRLIQAIVSLNGVTDRSKIEMAIQKMPARDSKELRRYIDSHEPGIKMESEMECPHCQAVSSVRLPLGPSFFWPED